MFFGLYRMRAFSVSGSPRLFQQHMIWCQSQLLNGFYICADPLARTEDHHAGLSAVWRPFEEQERTVAHINVIDIRHNGNAILWAENLHSLQLGRQM